MKMLLKVAAVLALAAAPLRAEEWAVLGARAQGMGGAGVAVVDSVYAAYWNPGAFAFHPTGVEVKAYGAFQLSAEGEILQTLDEISDLLVATDWETVLSQKVDNGDPLTLAELQELLDIFVDTMSKLDEPGQGLLGVVQGGIGVGCGGFIFSGLWTMYGGADPELDLLTMAFSDDSDWATRIDNLVGAGADHSLDFTNPGSQALADSIAAGSNFTQDQAEELVWQSELVGIDTSDPDQAALIETIAQATDGGNPAVTSNNTGVTLSGISLQEYALTYALPLIPNTLGVGVNLKVMEGTTYYNFLRYDAIQDGQDIVDQLTDPKNEERSTALAADVGILFKPAPRLRLGLVARNVNSPEFERAGTTEDYKMEPQYRAGVAFSPIGGLTLAADLDLSTNTTDSLDGFESRLLAVGAEFKLMKSLALRAGAYENIESDVSSPVYTLGLGLHLPTLWLDIAAAMSGDEVPIEYGASSVSIRERFAISLSLTLGF